MFSNYRDTLSISDVDTLSEDSLNSFCVSVFEEIDADLENDNAGSDICGSSRGAKSVLRCSGTAVDGNNDNPIVDSENEGNKRVFDQNQQFADETNRSINNDG